jgi:uncharacterized membrane protein
VLAFLAGFDQNRKTSAGTATGDLTALGTEPFWTANIRADRATLSLRRL